MIFLLVLGLATIGLIAANLIAQRLFPTHRHEGPERRVPYQILVLGIFGGLVFLLALVGILTDGF